MKINKNITSKMISQIKYYHIDDNIIPDDNFVGLETLERLYNFNTTNVDSSVASIEYQGGSGFSQDDLCTNARLNNSILRTR